MRFSPNPLSPRFFSLMAVLLTVIAPVSYATLITINTLTVSPTATVPFRLGGTARGAEYDAIDVLVLAHLDGILRATLINSFVPANGNSFELIHWAAVEGAFQTFNLPPLNSGLAWDTSQFSTTGTITVTSTVPEPSVGMFSLMSLGLFLQHRRRKNG